MRDIVPVIRAICARGVTVVMIEHVMQAVMSLAEHVFVLAEGRIIAMGTPGEIAADPRVVEAYLGHGAAGGCAAAAMAELLAIAGLHAGYGETEMLRGIDLAVSDGEIVARARRQRRGQVARSTAPSPACCGPGAARSASAARRSSAPTRGNRRAPASSTCPRAGASSPI